MASGPATIEFETAERATVVRIAGEVDMSNAEGLSDELGARVGRTPWLVLDLSRCSYLDSAGLRMIARADLRCREAGAGLRIVVDEGGPVDRVLALTRMDGVLTVDRRLGDALGSAREEEPEGMRADGSRGGPAGEPDADGVQPAGGEGRLER